MKWETVTTRWGYYSSECIATAKPGINNSKLQDNPQKNGNPTTTGKFKSTTSELFPGSLWLSLVAAIVLLPSENTEDTRTLSSTKPLSSNLCLSLSFSALTFLFLNILRQFSSVYSGVEMQWGTLCDFLWPVKVKNNALEAKTGVCGGDIVLLHCCLTHQSPN